MFMDCDRALREVLRVLKPGGRLAVAVWDSVENNPAYAAEAALLEQTAGTPAADAVRAPFTLGDRERLTELFEDAGADRVVVGTAKGRAQFPSIRVMVEADLRGWLPVMGVILGEDQISRILEAAESALCAYVTDGGRVAFDVQAVIVTAAKARA
jgi:hypothetical protein